LRPRAKDRLREEGASLVEFALAFPVLAMLLLGVVDFGRALYCYHFVSYAAREATRYAIVRGNSWSGSCSAPPPATPGCEANSSDISSYVVSIVPQGIPVTSLSVTSTVAAGPDNYPTSTTCGTTPPSTPGCVVQVKVTYNFGLNVPFLHSITVPMSSQSEMVVSQ
jgi:Flp pilus assembly protein TadG